MNKVEEGRRWLAAANDDLKFARLAAANGFHAPACFHAQQAAEKGVKAVHFARGARTIMGHSIRKLIESLDPPVPALDRLLDDARELDLLYVPTRYPNGLDSGTPAEAFSETQSSRALSRAAAITTAAAAEIR